GDGRAIRPRALHEIPSIGPGEEHPASGGAAGGKRANERGEGAMTTQSMAGSPPRQTILVHSLMVRIAHWTNAVAMVIMIGSGWRIWNSDPIFDYYFPIWGTLGGDPAASQDLHNELGLASALQWHFAGMWLLVINGLVYFIYGVLSGHFRRTMFPVGPRAFLSDLVAALRFRLPHHPGVYNAV